MLYNPPSGSSDPNAPFVGKNAAGGTQGSKVPPAAVEYPQRELVALIAASGQAPTNTLLVQAAQALGRGLWVGDLTGTGDLAVATLGVVFPSLLRGMRIRAAATTPNTTTAPKLRVVNLGSAGGTVDFPIVKEDGSALAVGEIKVGRRYWYEADGAGNVTISGGGIQAGDLASTATPIAQAAKSGFNTQPYQSTQRVSMATAGTNVLATAVSGLVFPKQSASSLVRVSGTFIVRTPHAPGNGFGPSYFLLNVGGTAVQQATNNGYPGVVNLTPVLAQIGTKASPLPKGNLAISLQFGRADASAWDAIFLPNSVDESGYPPSTLFQLFIDEVEPT